MPSPADLDIYVTGPRLAAHGAEVLNLADEAAAADSVRPLSEQAILSLQHGTANVRHVLILAGGRVAGYGQLDLSSAEGPAGELVVRPGARRRGIGRMLSQALVAEAGGVPLRVWAHGDLPAAAALARAAGFRRTRALWQLARPLQAQLVQAPLAEPRLPAGISVRTFRVGADEDAWLAVNRRAFASHPEQGTWTRTDLELREGEPWFDPDGFFLAERDGRLAGFHWTKVHGQAAPASGPEAVGEVYVVGIDPSEQGTGLGRAMTLTGLHYLRQRGLGEVMLYVEEANTAAVGLYQSLGFERIATDVMYTSAVPGAPD